MKKSILLALLSIATANAHAQDLLQTLELALQRDPRLREAEATRNAVLEAKPQSIARLLPTLSITGELNRNSVLSKFQQVQLAFIAGARNVGFWNSAASINLTQPIYHHDYWVQLSQADSQIAEAEANYAAEQQNLMLRTARAYFDVLFAQDSRDFALAEQRAIERQLEEAKARFEVGMITITDVHEAQAGYDQARANLIQAENQVDNAREALQEIIGESSAALAGLVEEVPLKGPEPENIEDWSDLAQQSNFGIIAAENRSLVAKKGIDLQFAGHLPSMDLVGSAGFTDNNRPLGIPTEYQAIGMQVNVPMFSGGGVNSRVRQARHEYEAAQENLDGVRRAVKRQVKDAYRGILSAISQVEALRAAVGSSQSALEASEAGLEVGTRTMVDVLAEQRNLFRAKRDYARARYDYIVNSLALKQAAGTLSPEDFALVNQWLRANLQTDSAASGEPEL
ncbi:TolC family outer membrane protein [Methylocaldum sp. MU1018]